jgi:hypothetical protein
MELKSVICQWTIPSWCPGEFLDISLTHVFKESRIESFVDPSEIFNIGLIETEPNEDGIRICIN